MGKAKEAICRKCERTKETAFYIPCNFKASWKEKLPKKHDCQRVIEESLHLIASYLEYTNLLEFR